MSPQMYLWLFPGSREREEGRLDQHGKREVWGGVGVAPKTSQQFPGLSLAYRVSPNRRRAPLCSLRPP